MAITAPLKHRIQALKKQYDRLKKGRESLLTLINEVEISEGVYNSNAIENSTLTLKETEKILLEMEVSRNLSLREVFEAKNLGHVTQYIEKKTCADSITQAIILLLHRMLIANIDDEIAGRFRSSGEYVRIGTYIAPPPEQVEVLITKLLLQYSSNLESFPSDNIAQFHLEFEHIQPFCDGNGRIGRILINYQMLQIGFPPIIIRNKEKQEYYQAFRDYDETGKCKKMEKIVALAVMESFHKRNTYLESKKIISLSEYARKIGKSSPTVHNAASRQTIPAFREKGVWKIGM
jgi:Fic family protein